MLLVINSNNTTTVFGVYDGAEKRGVWRISTDPHRTAEAHPAGRCRPACAAGRPVAAH